jgi:ketosteroid isomerase-like protein
MKELFISIILFTFSTLIFAQTEEVQKVEEAINTLYQAYINPQREIIEPLVADELIYIHSGGKIEDKEAFINGLLNGSQFLTTQCENSIIRIKGNTAIANHVLVIETSKNDTYTKKSIGVTLVFQKEQDQWLLLARQAYKL